MAVIMTEPLLIGSKALPVVSLEYYPGVHGVLYICNYELFIQFIWISSWKY